MGKKGNKSRAGKTNSPEMRAKQSASALLLDQQAIKKLAWETRDRRYVCISPSGKRYNVNNLSRFCEKHRLSLPRMVELASWQRTGIRTPKRALHHRGWMCWKPGELPNNRRRIPKL